MIDKGNFRKKKKQEVKFEKHSFSYLIKSFSKFRIKAFFHAIDLIPFLYFTTLKRNMHQNPHKFYFYVLNQRYIDRLPRIGNKYPEIDHKISKFTTLIQFNKWMNWKSILLSRFVFLWGYLYMWKPIFIIYHRIHLTYTHKFISLLAIL